MSKKPAAIPADYADWLAGIKTRVHAARSRAALAANAELIALYWQIGEDLFAKAAVRKLGRQGARPSGK